MEDVTAQLLWIGLSEERAKQTMKNEALTKLLLEMIAILWKGGNSGEVLDRDVGKLVYLAATTTKIQIRQHLPLVLEYLASKKIDSEAKLAVATEFLLVNPTSVDIQQFEQSAGVGLTVTQQQIADTVKAQIEKNRSELLEKRYRFGLGCILGDLRKDKILRFADGKAIKAEVDAQVLALLGPKNESDNAKPKKEPKEGNKENKKAVDAAAKEKECKDIVELLKRISFHGVGENYKTDGYVITPNTMKLLSEHVRVTGGKVFTQFPPEPNGILHIGHVKTINFSYAQANDGHCYLRYDDTNPEKEEERFVVGIKCMVEWLGYKPYKITYYTNYFDELYAFAVTLIKKDLAYTCPKNCNNINRLPPPSTSFSSSSSPLKSGASWEFIYKRSLHCSNAQNRRLKCFM